MRRSAGETPAMPTISESDDEGKEDPAYFGSMVGSAVLMAPQNPPDREGNVGELAALMGTQAIRKQTPEQQHVAGSLRFMKTVHAEKGTLNYVRADGWEEIELAVDSGASETVIGPEMAQSAVMQEGEAFKLNKVYELADGVTIPNLGEKEFVGVSAEGIQRSMKAQVCDINKGLLSVSRVVNAGNRVAFDPDGSYIEDAQGKKMWMKQRGGIYMLKLWTNTEGSRDF